ncbi:hypothetical protein RFI_31457, partial [Reticulomyxa filosa]
TLSNLLIPLEAVSRNSLLMESPLHVHGETNKIRIKKDFFNEMPKFLDRDRLNSEVSSRDIHAETSNTTYTAIAHQHLKRQQQEQERDTEKEQLLLQDEKTEGGRIKQEHIGRLSNLFFYLKEKEKDAIEFGWIGHQSIPDEAKRQLFPSLLSNVLSYSISALEARFRSLSRQEIHDKLPTQLQFNNTVVSSIWATLTTHYFQQKDANDKKTLFPHKGMDQFYQSCWARLVSLFGSSNSDEPLSSETFIFVMLFCLCVCVLFIFVLFHFISNDENGVDYKDVVSTQDPFTVMTRACLTHPFLFSWKTTDRFGIETMTSAMEVRANATLNDMYHVLMGCYLWNILQVLLGDLFATDEQ